MLFRETLFKHKMCYSPILWNMEDVTILNIYFITAAENPPAR